MNVDLSIVIISFGDPDVLFKSLGRSIRQLQKLQNISHEIIIVDNFSTLEYRNKFLSRANRFSIFHLKFILNPGNPGFGVACNIGARQASGSVLWFINPDAWVNDLSDLDSLLDFTAKESVGAVSTICKLHEGSLAQMPRVKMTAQYLFLSNMRIGSLYRNIKGKELFPPIILVINSLLRLSKSFRDYDSSYDTVSHIQETDIVGGSSFLIQRSLHEAMGGFDEDYFLYDEDYDYCLRLKRLGKHNFIHPGAQVAMHVSGTIHQVSNSIIHRHKKASRLLFIRKHFNGPWKLLLLFQCHLFW